MDLDNCIDKLSNSWLSHYLEVLHHNVDAVLGLAVPVAAPAHVVAAVLRLGPVNGQGVVKQDPHPGAPVQRVAILQPGDARLNAAVHITGYPDERVQREPEMYSVVRKQFGQNDCTHLV